ncbi:MAG: hypothetical protein JJE47_06960 [Acidimicrobiia bacterium]|nr:hypothetical protein [Acidimicrobiia bacterium]
MFALARYTGPVLILIGGIWFAQGVGWLPGSFMTGSTFWTVVGSVSVVVGGWLSSLGWRTTSRKSRSW